MDASLDSAPLLALILAADFAITSLHSYQELKGVGAPLWRNFGAIAGLDVPDRLGFLFFTVVLTLILFTTGFVGIAGLFGPCLTAVALGALIGARLSDTIVSRLALHRGLPSQSWAHFHAALRHRVSLLDGSSRHVWQPSHALHSSAWSSAF
jgi:hypothetical protein